MAFCMWGWGGWVVGFVVCVLLEAPALTECRHVIAIRGRGVHSRLPWCVCARRLGLEGEAERSGKIRVIPTLRLRGGRRKAREEMYDDDNEKVAREFLERMKGEDIGGGDLKEGEGEVEVEVESAAEGGSRFDAQLAGDIELEEGEKRRRVHVRSLHWNLVHKTAMALLLPDEAWRQIQTVRVEHDRDIGKWPMPAILLCHPCFSPGWLWEAADALENRLRNANPFRIRLSSFKMVKHAQTTSIWLVPDEPSLERIEKLYFEILELFPSLRSKAHRMAAGEAPHVEMGQFLEERRAQEMIESLSASWEPVEFDVTHVGVMRQQHDVATCCFDTFREVALGQVGEDALEKGVLSDAEANLASGSDYEAVVQEWNQDKGKFAPVHDGLLGEMNREHKERRVKEMEARKKKQEAEAREFLKLPAKEDEGCTELVPEQTRNQICQLLESRGTIKLFELVKSFRREYREDLAQLAKDLGFSTTSAMFRISIKETFLTRSGKDVFVHLTIPDEEKERRTRRARLRRELKAMKGRDLQEREKLGSAHRRIKEAEDRIISKFKKHITTEDAVAMDQLAIDRAMEERDRTRDGMQDLDAETQRLYDELDRLSSTTPLLAAVPPSQPP